VLLFVRRRFLIGGTNLMELEHSTHATPLRERGIPMTTEVLRRLETEASRLVGHLPTLQASAQEDSVSGDRETPTVLAAGDLHLAASRLASIRRVMGEGYIVEPDGRAIVGSRVTVCYGDGAQDTYELVAPGESDVRNYRISTDSPLGAALLGRRADDIANMHTPSGLQEFTVVDVQI
jgi:transcription elongation GreA/GreB family factor